MVCWKPGTPAAVISRQQHFILILVVDDHSHMLCNGRHFLIPQRTKVASVTAGSVAAERTSVLHLLRGVCTLRYGMAGPTAGN